MSFIPAPAPVMLGLLAGENSKHAVVCVGQAVNGFRFINNRHSSTSGPDELMLAAAGLLSRTILQVATPEPMDLKPLLTASLHTMGLIHAGIG